MQQVYHSHPQRKCGNKDRPLSTEMVYTALVPTAAWLSVMGGRDIQYVQGY